MCSNARDGRAAFSRPESSNLTQNNTGDAVNTPESADHYPHVVLVNANHRIIECNNHIQWILQVADGGVGHRRWRNKSYCRSKNALTRLWPYPISEMNPSDAAILNALPDWIETQDAKSI